MNDVRKAANGTTVDCAVFQDQLPSLFESGEDLSAQEHLKTCENCSALVRDLEYIARTSQAIAAYPRSQPGGMGEHPDCVEERAFAREVGA